VHRGLSLLLLLSSLAATGQGLDAVRALQQKGALREAQKACEALLPQLRGKDQASLGEALNLLSVLATAQGDYDLALGRAREALQVFRTLGDPVGETRARNNSGNAHMYRGDYPDALADFTEALAVARQHGHRESEVDALNNIGSNHFIRASYLDALRAYREALALVGSAASEPWSARKRGITVANLAALFQRLGQEQSALSLYADLRKDWAQLSVSEQGRLLINQGVLYRRLGDPLKALETYRAASALLSRDEHNDGRIGVLKNIGIVQALDLGKLEAAREAFNEALTLSEKTGNKREAMQAHLYLGETQALRNDSAAAEAQFAAALNAAKELGTTEEQWKALYGVGRAQYLSGHPDLAAARFREAVAIIESTRAKLQLPSLKTDFLADKRDVYDALVELTLPSGDAAALFDLLERSRARNFQDRISQAQPGLGAVQARLDDKALLLEFWVGPRGKAAVLGITSKAAFAVPIAAPDADLDDLLRQVSSEAGDGWKTLSASVGDGLLAAVPMLSQPGISQLIIVPDGPLTGLPFEVLAPAGGPLLVERFAISYLPSASLLLREPPRARFWSLPWQRQLLAFADPRIGSGTGAADALGGAELQDRLPASADEARAIGQSCRGRSELHLGPDDLKRYLLQARAAPLLHLATHATADVSSPERSRILFSPAAPGDRADYLFLKEVYGLDLRGVDLATLSACDTERGKSVRGEGVQGFSRALLAAGARASITALWRVADEPSRELMKQLYFELNRGAPKAEALRSAKLRFLRSNSELRQPRFWAPFVLSGDGGRPIPGVVPWSYLLAALAALVLAALALQRLWRSTRGPG
jgi:CHAT domain-containing protein/tetratricopeptide (TPR) repeat protein